MKLSTLSYFKTGGTCDALHAPTSLSELQEVMQRLHGQRTPYFILGGGTNSLVSDAHWQGAVLSLHRMTTLANEGEVVMCHAGVLNSALVEHCLARGLTGAEWMTALPGQIGATVRMNARCYGGEISTMVQSVTTVTATGALRVYEQPREVFHGYKDTLFMHNGEVVATVKLCLREGQADKIAARMAEVRGDRVRKGQFLHPSCGCVFKNDYEVGVPSGVLLEKAGVRQLAQKKGVSISPRHANFIFNVGGSSDAIVSLSLAMREAVYRQFAVWLHYEMEFLGYFSPAQQRALVRTETHDLCNPALLRVKREWHSMQQTVLQ